MVQIWFQRGNAGKDHVSRVILITGTLRIGRKAVLFTAFRFCMDNVKQPTIGFGVLLNKREPNRALPRILSVDLILEGGQNVALPTRDFSDSPWAFYCDKPSAGDFLR